MQIIYIQRLIGFILYSENCWTTSSLDRTTYQDQSVFDNPYATDYDDTLTPVFPDILGITNKYGASIYFSYAIYRVVAPIIG